MGCKNYNSEDGICLCCYEETHDSGDEECNSYDGDKVNDDIVSLRAQLAAAQAEVERLRAWKESATEVESEWDAQAIARMLGGIAGDSCRRVVAEKVPRLLSDLAALRARDEGRVERVAEELKRQFTVGVGQVQWWAARARAVLAAADGEVKP